MPQEQIHAKVSQPASKNATTAADIDRAIEEASQRDRSDLVEHSDEILDEIDACLEENVLEVLRTFVNRGGQ